MLSIQFVIDSETISLKFQIPKSLFQDLHLYFQCFCFIQNVRLARFDFEIIFSPFLHCDVSRRTSYDVYMSQLIRFARICFYVNYSNARNKCLSAFTSRKDFAKFYRQHNELVSKFNVAFA